MIVLSKSHKKFVSNFICFIINYDLLSLFDCIIRSSSLWNLQEIKLIANINWIFHEWDFMIWYMICFKYGLILLRYSLTDSVFISHYRKAVIFNIIVIQKKMIFFLVLKKIPNNCVFNSSCFLRIKRFLISLIAASFDSFF